MHLYSTKCSCFSFGKHLPAISHLCKRVVKSLRKVEGSSPKVRSVSVSHRVTEQSGGAWRWEDNHHHTGTTEMLSISMLQVRTYAPKIHEGLWEILCTT